MVFAADGPCGDALLRLGLDDASSDKKVLADERPRVLADARQMSDVPFRAFDDRHQTGTAIRSQPILAGSLLIGAAMR